MKRQRTKILLVEDEPGIAKLIVRTLGRDGYDVTHFSDGRDGLDEIRRGRYDVVLIDHQLPGLSGLDVLHELQNVPEAPPCIMITGAGGESLAVSAFKEGAADYITKDVHGEYLRILPRTIEGVLRNVKDAAALEEAEHEQQRLLTELKERIKELGCLYGTEKLLAAAGDSPHVVLQEIVRLLPHQTSEGLSCCSRISLLGHIFESENFRETKWSRHFEIHEREHTAGSLTVYLLDQPEDKGRPLFPSEQEELYVAIAERLGQYFERRHNEERLHQIHDELRRLSRAVEQSASAVVITDAMGVIEYVNPKFTEMTGYSASEVIGKDPSILKGGDKPSAVYAALWDTITAGGEWSGEFHNRRKDGSLYWDHSTISPVIDSHGVITHFVAVKEDISARKESDYLRNAVLHISAAIAGCQTEDELCRVVVEGVRSEMGFDRCGLFLGDVNGTVFKGTYGTDLHGQTTDEHHYEHNLGESRDLDPLFEGASYIKNLPLGSPPAREGEEGLTAVLIALRQRGRVFGVISVDNRITHRPYTETQLIHCTLLAEVLGNALQTARARQALKESMDKYQQANEELEEFNLAMVGREERIIELKEEVNELLRRSKEPVRYPAIWHEGSAPAEEPISAPMEARGDG